jgi:ABC-2 type transport system permease protein
LRAPSAEDLANFQALASYVGTLLTTAPLSWLLAPARWVVQPVLAPDVRSFGLALGPALLVYVLHYVWVLHSEVSFEEASIAKAEKRAARRQAARQAGVRFGKTERKAQRVPFSLANVRRPELAFLWKNLLSSASYLRPRVALTVAAVIVVVSIWLVRADVEPFRSVVSVLGLVAAGYTFVFGPMVARQDLRLDLPNADILKTYPLRGWQIVLGEILAPVATVTVLLWLMLLASLLTAHPPRVEWWTVGTQVAVAVAVALLLPPLCALQVLVMNAAVVLFPAWVPQGPDQGRGVDVIGQRIFFVAGVFLTMTLSLLPGAIAAAIVFFAVQWTVGVLVLAGLAAAVVALAILCSEVWLVVVWLGGRFERFDLSAELRP